MNEHSFIRAIHKSLPAEVYRWKIHDTFTGGVPDTKSNFSWNSVAQKTNEILDKILSNISFILGAMESQEKMLLRFTNLYYYTHTSFWLNKYEKMI